MVNFIGVKVIEYLKVLGIFASVIGAFFIGKLRADNERLEENLKDKQSEIKSINDTQKRIAKYDNTPTSDKRSWLRSRSKAK